MRRDLLLILMLVMLSFTLAIGCDSSDDTDGDIDGDTTDVDIVDDDTADGDTTEEDIVDDDATDGDTTEEDMVDNDTTDGDTTEEDMVDNDTTDGDTTEEDMVDGDTTDGDTTEEDTAEEDMVEDEAEVIEEEVEITVQPGENCTNPIIIDAIPYNNASNAIANFVNDIDFANGSESCTGYSNIGWDKVFAYTATSDIDLTVSMTSNGWDGGLYMLNACVDGTQAQNNCTYGIDDHGADTAEWINFSATNGTTYYFVVDIAAAEYAPSDQGAFRMQLHEYTGSK